MRFNGQYRHKNEWEALWRNVQSSEANSTGRPINDRTTPKLSAFPFHMSGKGYEIPPTDEVHQERVEHSNVRTPDTGVNGFHTVTRNIRWLRMGDIERGASKTTTALWWKPVGCCDLEKAPMGRPLSLFVAPSLAIYSVRGRALENLGLNTTEGPPGVAPFRSSCL